MAALCLFLIATSFASTLTKAKGVVSNNDAVPKCSEWQFRCTNGLCTDRTAVCDGDNDCGDWSDEANCNLQTDRTFSLSELCSRDPGGNAKLFLGTTTKSLASAAVIKADFKTEIYGNCKLEVSAPTGHRVVASLRKLKLGPNCGHKLMLSADNMTHTFCEMPYDGYENRTVAGEGILTIELVAESRWSMISDTMGFQLTVTAYRDAPCDSTAEFSCENNRCIAKELNCSEYNHCGDNSNQKCALQKMRTFYFSDLCPSIPGGRAHLSLGGVTEGFKSTAVIKADPAGYPDNCNCQLEVDVPTGHSVVASVRRIQLRGVCVDNLTIFAGDTNETYCGLWYDEYENLTVEARGFMVIEFVSEWSSRRLHLLKAIDFQLTVTAYRDGPCSNSTDFSCENNRCIAGELNCSEHNHCGDNSNQHCGTPIAPQHCSSSKFMCANARCIFPTKVCDGRDDCGDLTDEMNCTYACDPRLFSCKNGYCVYSWKVCDKTNDCGDGSDEENCQYPCDPWEFTCTNGFCISKSRVCDKTTDCEDGSDEQNCTHTCMPGWFTCTNGHCVSSSSVCDKYDDCGDGSDEENCASPMTESSENGGYLTPFIISAVIAAGLLFVIVGVVMCLKR